MCGEAFPDAATFITSESTTQSSREPTVWTLRPSSLDISSQKEEALSLLRSKTFTSFRSLRTYARDIREALLITPAATIPATSESGLARYLAPTPGIAPVLIALTRLADIKANGSEVSGSFRMIFRIDLGSPLDGLIM